MTRRGAPQRISTAAEREAAVRLYIEVGPSEAARRTGWSKGAIIGWAKAAEAPPVATESVRAAIEQREARRELSVAEWRARMTEALTNVSLLAAELELAHLSETGIDAPSLPHVIQARRTAVNDLLLITGEPTSRTATLQELPAVAANAARLRDELAARREARA